MERQHRQLHEGEEERRKEELTGKDGPNHMHFDIRKTLDLKPSSATFS